MAYEVTARRWRPQEFDGVVGQSHVVTTLTNAIRSGQIAHAYLFAGPRGVGKTTTARLLAKALNCVNGPTITPCNACSFCREITEGRSVDVLEIDGASNNKVEQIRSFLLESIKYTPSQGKHKIYIIDEVHMLTKEAFNALLKTLEEPPAHVYFIFATTDPQKVLPTILSRCQRFDFRRISGQSIVDHLAMIAENSGYSIQREALAIVARRADGSMRDAESLFDQVVAFGGPSLSTSDVASVLGMVAQDVYFDLLDAISCQDSTQGLDLIHQIIHQGYNLDEVALGILEHVRNLLVIKVAPDKPDFLEAVVFDMDRYRNQAERFNTEDLVRLAQLATQMEEAIRSSALPRVQMEIGIVRMSRMEPSVLLADVLARLNELGQRIATGTDEEMVTPSLQPKTDTPKTVAAPPLERAPVTKSIRESPPKAPTAATRSVAVSMNTTPATAVVATEVSPSAQTAQVVGTDAGPSVNVTRDLLIREWPSLRERITQKRISLGNFLAVAAILEYQNNTVTLVFSSQNEFHKQQAEKKEHTQVIQEVFSERIGAPVRITCVLSDAPLPDTVPPITREKLPEVNAYTIAKQDPAVKRLLDEFDGQIIGD